MREIQCVGWKKYKSDEAIPDGVYYALYGKLSEQQKRNLHPIAGQSPKGTFSWLLPAERWIKYIVEGYIAPESSFFDRGKYANLPEHAFHRAWVKYMLEAARACYKKSGYVRRGCVAPLGAGKTLFGLALCEEFQPAIVAAPTYLHKSWRDEAQKWGVTCPTLSTYESLKKHLDKPYRTLYMDEVLAVKNPGAQRTQAALELSKKCQVVIGATGTPTSVSPMDWRWLRVVFPGSVPLQDGCWKFLFGEDTTLVEVAPERKAWITTKWNDPKVADLVHPYVTTIPKSEIEQELPELIYRQITVPAPAQWRMIIRGACTERGGSKIAMQARQSSDGFVLNDLEQVQRVNTNKIDAIKEFIENECPKEPVVIFAAWNESVTQLAAAFPGAAVLRGGADYSEELKRWLEGETLILIANSRISSGMNLQQARVEIFMSNDTSPVNRTQAEGRIVRPGQKRGCIIVDVLAEGTLDERLLGLLREHREQSSGYIEALLERDLEGMKSAVPRG